MPTPKQLTLDILATVPDDATFEDIHYRLYMLQKIEAGQRDLDQGRYIDDEDMDKRVAAWLDESGGRAKQATI